MTLRHLDKLEGIKVNGYNNVVPTTIPSGSSLYTFRPEAVPTEYTSHTAIYSCVGAPLSAKKETPEKEGLEKTDANKR